MNEKPIGFTTPEQRRISELEAEKASLKKRNAELEAQLAQAKQTIHDFQSEQSKARPVQQSGYPYV